MSTSRWERFVWPRWLPETMRMPLIAQVTGAVALTALIMAPWWSQVPSARSMEPASVTHELRAVPLKPAVTAAVPLAQQPSTRPAHLNLDVRHSFARIDMTVTVDGKRVLDSRLEGNGKKFRMFGKRAERGYTRALDLTPGVRVVNVRLRSARDQFDQARTERFDLAPASVASMRMTAARGGLEVIAQHPPAQPPSPAPAPAAPGTASPPGTAATAVPIPAALPASQRADTLAELLQSLRSMLIAIAGFVASAATGFVVQEYLRSRRGAIFAEGERRGRRRRRVQGAVETP